MFVVGITGGIGSGKTAVTNKLQSLGITVVDADMVSREVVEPGQPALKKIKDHFGEAILLLDGHLNRAALRNIIFQNPVERKWLESLLHPLISSEIQRQLNTANSEYVVLVSPLLVETGQKHLTDKILVIDTTEDLQLKRASARDGITETQVKAIMEAQASREERKKIADDVIVNDKGLDYLEQQTEALHQRYLGLALESQKNI